MARDEFLHPDRVACGELAESRKQALERLSTLLAASSTRLTAAEIYLLLNAREHLGSTCIGHGAALPHGKDQDLEAPVAALLLLAMPVDFDSSDDEGVSILAGVLLPDHGGEAEFSALHSLMSDEVSLAALRNARSPGEAAMLVTNRLQQGDSPAAASD